MLKLRPFKACDAAAVAGWFTDEAMMHRWCANEFTDYPLTAEALLAYYQEREQCPDYFAMTAFDENGPVGHCILEYKDAAKSVLWLGFVVIDPAKRGMGLGRELVSLAIRFAFELAGAEKLTLAVFKNNPHALRCYTSLGFRPVPDDHPPLTVLGEIWPAVFMELNKGDQTL